MSRRHRIAVLCAVPAFATGCGSGDEDQPTRLLGSMKPPDGVVNVDLTEYRIRARPSTVRAGDVTFRAVNDGAIPHELVVIRTPKPAAALLTGMKADEHGRVGELEEGALGVGAKKALTLNLPPGHYALICNLPGHYQGGMHADLTVR